MWRFMRATGAQLAAGMEKHDSHFQTMTEYPVIICCCFSFWDFEIYLYKKPNETKVKCWIAGEPLFQCQMKLLPTLPKTATKVLSFTEAKANLKQLTS